MIKDEGYRQAKEQIAQLEAELAEFQASSRELERELEVELEESENKHKQQQDKVDELTHELNEWKNKHLELNKEYASTQASLQKQIASLQTAHKMATSQLTEIEMTNDDMERHDRIQKSSLQEMENKYYKCLEEIAMLESEVATKDDIQIELQRTKDELRDTKEELSVANNKIVHLEKEAEEMKDKVDTIDESPTAAVIRTRKFRITSDPSAAMSAVTATSENTNNTTSTSNQSLSLSNDLPLPRLASSKSLRKIHGMLDQMRNLESRVANFKSSLPKPVTPSRSPATSMNSNSNSPSPITNNKNSPSNLPISSSRRNSSILFLDRALNEKHALKTTQSQSQNEQQKQKHHHHQQQPPEYSLRKPPQTKFGLDPIQGSPTTTTSTTTATHDIGNTNTRHLRKQPSVDSTNGLNGNQDFRNIKRPGSAFSALHTRTGIGHGRFV